MEYLILVISIVLGVFILSSIHTLSNYYPYYKRVYKTLPSLTFNKGVRQYKTTDGKVIWFIQSNDFKLDNGVYIHNEYYTYFDPYSLYWLIKYRMWFKRNVKS